MTSLTHDVQDRARGALIGGAVGDALGVPYEFSQRLASTGIPVMRGGGLGDFAPGEWSDDTSMAMGVAMAGARHRTFGTQSALDDVAAGFLDWFESHPPDIGNQTRAVLGAVQRGASDTGLSTRTLDASRDFAQTARHTGGNGALMRTAPVALAHLNDRNALADAAQNVARLTHFDDEAADSCVLWCEAIRVAVVDARIDVYAGLELIDNSRRDWWRTRLDEARDQNPNSFTPNGYTVTALQAAASSVLHAQGDGADHLRDGLHTAIRIGDDTDTVAAIAGGLLGARWGRSAIDEQSQADIHGWPIRSGVPARVAGLVTLADGLVGA
ncbi:ADP-ribosylglycohydrolase family protein [Gordonia sp. PDNC005]|uniref:ADP-ribosylglycohydrolase family protein n=1 Tax=unclassified Gordonia (in: high G+C Gram-positive bacteria) TaxID=2657482 RepID=UPI001964C876|nr:ADP-ribosylglycohydrolase family protein [Gordonia sp. PDNC005]QRY61002.1 ADP-ribosylglycohydrolase family protein [Gordonia sp. PDNC005]